MCGIAGAFTSRSDFLLGERIRSALHLLQHRGPDGDYQTSHDVAGGHCVLGHRRLSIIDLSAKGRQPMISSNGRFVITFNGEIYNYKELRAEIERLGGKFSSNTDTEVLLEAWSLWGSACLPRLTGMFAFAILDRERQVIECARDPFGIKPLFYEQTQTQFAFSSEIAALQQINPRRNAPNMQRAFDYLSLGRYDDQVDTFVEGIFHLRPGCKLTVSLGKSIRVSTERWWWPSIEKNETLAFDDAVEKIRSEFLQNVRLHLRSDVPTGAALSGGLDSSALVCAMRHLDPKMEIQTFSYIAAQGAANEERWVDIVNSHVGAVPNKVRIEDGDLLTDLDDLILTHGEPFGSTSVYAGYRVFKMVRDAGVVVCLEGQGADEILAGYHGYPHACLRSLIERGHLGEMGQLLKAWGEWPGRKRSDAVLRLISDFLPDRLQRLGRQLVGRDVVKPWLRRDVLQNAGVTLQPYSMTPRTAEGFGRRLAETQRALLSGSGFSHLLRHGDRNSMRWSVENRVPFLTRQMAELALSFPERYLLSKRGETKSVFRAAMRGIVPDAIIDRRDKVGFETPELRWLNADRRVMENVLSAADEISFLDVDDLRKEFRAISDGAKPFSWQAWRIINYCKWYRLVLMS